MAGPSAVVPEAKARKQVHPGGPRCDSNGRVHRPVLMSKAAAKRQAAWTDRHRIIEEVTTNLTNSTNKLSGTTVLVVRDFA